MSSSPEHGSSSFPPTQWTLVLRARDGGDETVAGALSSLCSSYWQPVYAYFRRSGNTQHDAEDLTQGFFADLLARDFLGNVGAEKGRFRTFVLTSAKNFLAKDWRRRSAAKRGGGEVPLSLDFEDAERAFQLEPADRLTPDLVFERRWVLTLLDKVLKSLQTEYENTGRGELFAALSGGLTASGASASHAEVAGMLGIKEGAVKVAAHRLKKRYREALKDEVARTVDREEEVEAELGHLMTIFARR